MIVTGSEDQGQLRRAAEPVSHPQGSAAATLILAAGRLLTPDRSCLLGLEGLERVNLDELDKGVELLLGLLVLVSLSRDSDAHFAGDVPDASGPDLSVEQWVNAHFLHTAGKQQPIRFCSIHIMKEIDRSRHPGGTPGLCKWRG